MKAQAGLKTNNCANQMKEMNILLKIGIEAEAKSPFEEANYEKLVLVES